MKHVFFCSSVCDVAKGTGTLQYISQASDLTMRFFFFFVRTRLSYSRKLTVFGTALFFMESKELKT